MQSTLDCTALNFTACWTCGRSCVYNFLETTAYELSHIETHKQTHKQAKHFNYNEVFQSPCPCSSISCKTFIVTYEVETVWLSAGYLTLESIPKFDTCYSSSFVVDTYNLLKCRPAWHICHLGLCSDFYTNTMLLYPPAKASTKKRLKGRLSPLCLTNKSVYTVHLIATNKSD